MKYHFTDIFDIAELRSLCESFTKLNGAAIAVLDLEGTVHVASGWQPICTKFHREHCLTRQLCSESDTVLACQLMLGQKYTMYKCKNGMVDVAMPIIVGGTHVGNFFTGQFLLEPPNIEHFRAQARNYNFDEAQYIAALRQVPVHSEEQMRSTIEFLVQLAESIGKIGLQHLQRIELAQQLELDRQALHDATAAAEQNRQYVQMLFDLSPTGLALSRLNGELVSINQSYADIIGYSIDEVKQLTYWDITPSKYNDQEQIQLQNLKSRGYYGPYEKEYIHKSGALVPVRLIGRIVTVGSEQYIWSSVENITDRKAKEAELENAKLLLEQTLEQSPVPMILAGAPDAHLLNVNSAAKALFGIADEPSAVGNSLYALQPTFSGFDAQGNHDEVSDWPLVKSLAGIKTENDERLILRKDGSSIWGLVNSKPIVNAKNEIIAGVLTMLDISEQKQNLSKLRESEERYRSLIDNLNSGVVVHGPDTAIRLYNQRASELLGLTDDQMMGKAAMDPQWHFISDTYEPLPISQYPAIQVLTTLLPLKNMIIGANRPETNDIAWTVVNGNPIFDSDGKLAEIVISFNEITDLKTSEQLLVEKTTKSLHR